MNVHGVPQRTIWLKPNDSQVVQIIDQRFLPHKFVIEELKSVDEVVVAIKDMHVRGAPLIGATAAFGMYLAALAIQKRNLSEKYLTKAANHLLGSRPTAVNLSWAVHKQLANIQQGKSVEEKVSIALQVAEAIVEEEVKCCKRIGEYGCEIITRISQAKGKGRVNILTHCNAGWLACIDHGTALAPIYSAHDKNMDLHVWVDETRPRNQGARLTAWELKEQGIPHTVICDNTGGFLMQKGMVDVVIVGTDRTTKNGDVANKIGTYLKALAAVDNDIPFYVALPSSSIDWEIENAMENIPIEERSPDEVTFIQGLLGEKIEKVLLTPAESPAVNYAFDITPARLISGYITEKGILEGREKTNFSALFQAMP